MKHLLILALLVVLSALNGCDLQTEIDDDINPEFAQPACVHGMTCCDDGHWACNDPQGPTCTEGTDCPLPECGGISGLTCHTGTCVDYPYDSCKPPNGVDCAGVCIEL